MTALQALLNLEKRPRAGHKIEATIRTLLSEAPSPSIVFICVSSKVTSCFAAWPHLSGRRDSPRAPPSSPLCSATRHTGWTF